MSKGELAIVLHAHLPYVRSSEPGSLEEDWFFQALFECYIPLLRTLEAASTCNEQNPKLTIGLSPTLLSLFNDQELKNRFPKWLSIRLRLLKEITDCRVLAAKALSSRIQTIQKDWENCKGDLINRFAALQQLEVLDILTCAATHGYLPLLRENPEAVRGQLKTAVKEHERLFKRKPLGIWLPECAFYEGLDELMEEAGLKYAVLDGHGLLHANPRPRYGLYAPICSQKGIAFFGRDSDSTLPVWSAKDGYPGASEYREFHRDIGWDLTNKKLQEIGLDSPRPLCIKLHKVTDQKISLEKKDVYDPQSASRKVKEHAKQYIFDRQKQLNKLEEKMGINALLVAPFDAELFGHWWFEGPEFLSEIFLQAGINQLKLTRLKDVLLKSPKLQLCEPSPSSWGQGGYHHYWLNESNSWVVNEWSKAAKAMMHNCNFKIKNERHSRLLKQAARELLLLQSSDWSFILRAGTTTELAKERIERHLNRFWKLINSLAKEEGISNRTLAKIEKEDCLFPLIEIKDWSAY